MIPQISVYVTRIVGATNGSIFLIEILYRIYIILLLLLWCKIMKAHMKNNSQLIAVISYLQVVDDGDGVPVPVDGADHAPGSVLHIELQDVIQVVVQCVTAYIVLLSVHELCW